MKKKTRKPGRPKVGDKKRVRMSMTLKPELAMWVQDAAVQKGMSASSLVEEMIAYTRSSRTKKRAIWESRLGVTKEEITAMCEANGIEKLALFGSVLRDDFRTESDVDLLVNFVKGLRLSLFDFVEMKQRFEALFGRNVDMVEEKTLVNPVRKREILKNRELIYEA